jgi:hypothetical protein
LFWLKDVGGQACERTNSNGNFTALPWECQGKAMRNFETAAFLDENEKKAARMRAASTPRRFSA